MTGCKRLKLLEVSEPNKDGVFVHVRGLLRFLRAKKHVVHYAYSSVRSESQLGMMLRDLDGPGFSSEDLLIGNIPGLRDVAAFGYILWNIAIYRPDVVHGHSAKAGALVRIAASIVPVPCVYTPHAYYSMHEVPRGGRRIYWWIERALARLAWTINISSDEQKFGRAVLGVPSRTGSVIANPVDVSRFSRNRETGGEMRQRLGIAEAAVVIGTVGRLCDQKDPWCLYQGVERVLERVPGTVFVHVGVGERLSEIDSWVRARGFHNRVIRIPYVADPAAVYQMFDMFVLTSKFEAGWPIVMIEALATELPIVSTKFVGWRAVAPDILSHCKWVDVGDYAAFADGVVDAINRHWIGEANNHRNVAKEWFSVERCFGDVERLYFRLSGQQYPVI